MPHTLPPSDNLLRALTRRYFFKQSAFGIGAAALGSLLHPSLGSAASATNPLSPKPPMFPAKAKSIIYLFMAGAPSQVDLFDFKPTLQKYDGQNVPEELMKGERFAFIKGTPRLLGSPYEFAQFGDSGAQISELLPHLRTVADEITVVRSMHTSQFNHAPAQIFMNTGFQIIGRPSMGSWMTYGLVASARICPASWCSSPVRTNPMAGRLVGEAGSCPRSIKALSSARKAIRCCSLPIPKASRSKRDANPSICSKT